MHLTQADFKGVCITAKFNNRLGIFFSTNRWLKRKLNSSRYSCRYLPDTPCRAPNKNVFKLPIAVESKITIHRLNDLPIPTPYNTVFGQ